MSITIGTTLAGTISAATGDSTENHLIYSTNDKSYWVFFEGSGSTTTIQCYASTDLVTWTSKTSLTIGSSRTHDSDSRQFSVAYKNISSNDVIGLSGQYGAATNFFPHYCRATISGGAITWGTDSELYTGSIGSGPVPENAAVGFDSSSKIFVTSQQNGDMDCSKSTNADAGSSWTSGFGTHTSIDSSYANTCNRACMFPLASGKMLILAEDASAAEATSMKNVLSKTWDGTTISPGAGSAGTSIFTILGAGVSPDNFGACRVSDTDVHCVLRTGSNTYVHKRFNGTNWTTVAGVSITNQNSGAGTGVYLGTDGTDVYMGIIDSDAANTVRWCKWSSVLNTWGAWNALETTTKTRKYLTGLVANGNLILMWSETNGSNFDLVYNYVGIGSLPRPVLVNQAVRRAANY